MARSKKTRKPAKAPARARTPRPNYRTVTPYIAVDNASEAIDWYKRAFDAKEIQRQPTPDGKLMHAEIKIGDSMVMLSDVFPGSDVSDPRILKGTTANMHLYSKDIDRIWKKAVEAGARVTMPLDNQFWGDRYGKLTDPFGHSWGFSYPARMSNAEKERKREEAMKSFGGGGEPAAGEGGSEAP